jgi:hypothetical protein
MRQGQREQPLPLWTLFADHSSLDVVAACKDHASIQHARSLRPQHGKSYTKSAAEEHGKHKVFMVVQRWCALPRNLTSTNSLSVRRHPWISRLTGRLK